MSNDQTLPPGQERREYFRIEDTLSMSARQVDSQQLPKLLKQLEHGLDSDFTVMSSLAGITQGVAGVLRKIELREPDVGRYLKSIDQKIELLGRAMMMQNSDLSEQQPTTVNLSASGMGFDYPEALASGATLELKMLLRPSFTGMLVYAQVLSCEPLEEGYHVRVDFTHIREHDRDVLIRHVLQRQGELLRQRNDLD